MGAKEVFSETAEAAQWSGGFLTSCTPMGLGPSSLPTVGKPTELPICISLLWMVPPARVPGPTRVPGAKQVFAESAPIPLCSVRNWLWKFKPLGPGERPFLLRHTQRT